MNTTDKPSTFLLINTLKTEVSKPCVVSIHRSPPLEWNTCTLTSNTNVSSKVKPRPYSGKVTKGQGWLLPCRPIPAYILYSSHNVYDINIVTLTSTSQFLHHIIISIMENFTFSQFPAAPIIPHCTVTSDMLTPHSRHCEVTLTFQGQTSHPGLQWCTCITLPTTFLTKTIALK